MLNHIRANVLLFAVTLVLCCVVYPLTLWVVGQSVFPNQAEGSLIKGEDGKTIGSRLIAQPFTGKEYFQPRPSAAGSGYDASASGPSNLAASNALLRDRVARQIGPLVKYADGPKKGELVGPDIDAWFQKQRGDYAAVWAKAHPKLAEQWVKDNTAIVADFLQKEEKDIKADASANALPFFEKYVQPEQYKGTWPAVVDKEVGGETKKVLEPVVKGEVIQAYFFDWWLRENPDAVLEKVPADMVMTSGSGLDPHITMKNTLFQMDDVVDEWVKKTGANRNEQHGIIEKLLNEKKFAPMLGLFGVEQVNVLEVNLELTKRMQSYPLKEPRR